MTNEAYNLKDLVDGLAEEGLELTEDVVVKVVKRAVAWLDRSAQLSATPFDDVARVIYPQVQRELVRLADKIDGKSDQPVDL